MFMKNIKILLLICVLVLSSCGSNKQEWNNINLNETETWVVLLNKELKDETWNLEERKEESLNRISEKSKEIVISENKKESEEIRKLLSKDAEIRKVDKIDFEGDWKIEYIILFESKDLYIKAWWANWKFKWYYILSFKDNKWQKIYEENYDWNTGDIKYELVVISDKKFISFERVDNWTGGHIQTKLFSIINWNNIIFDLSDRSIFEEEVRPYLLEGEEIGRVDLSISDIYSHNFFNSTCSFKWYLDWTRLTYDLIYENWKLEVTNVERKDFYSEWVKGYCFWWYEVEGIDNLTFKILSGHYAMDKNNCYEDIKIVDKSKCEQTETFNN